MGVTLYAHFGVIIPSKNIVEEQKDATIELVSSFMHPFEQSYMKMEKPKMGVIANKKHIDLTKSLKKNKESWQNSFTLKEPGVYQFFIEPVPYFEPNEGKYIKHLTKTIVEGFGAGEGWDEPVGLKAEIIPLTRPYGLFKGNIFSGKVLFEGDVVADASIEIEYYNAKGLKAPSETHVTQVVKTDNNGIFYFVMPQSGWWGFSALLEDDKTIKKDGKEYPVELGAVLWIRADEYK